MKLITLVGGGITTFLAGFFLTCIFHRRPENDRTVEGRTDIEETKSVEFSDDDFPPTTVYPGAFSWSFLEPQELQFGCAVQCDAAEEFFAKRLNDVDLSTDDRLKAAQQLWRGRSRRYAAEVVKFANRPSIGGESLQDFRGNVESSLQPNAILLDLQRGDYLWGAWLAFLRPHPDYVPTLLANLKKKRDKLPETILALGGSRDPRALQPLLDLLASSDYQIAGDAAEALGYLGMLEAEPKLIEALATDNGWRQVNAALALSRMGTARALPALERVASDDRYTGALSIRSTAEYAVKCIKEREKR